MPKVAELKLDAEGSLWAKIEGNFLESEGVISLYTEKEVKHLIKDVALAIIEQIKNDYCKVDE